MYVLVLVLASVFQAHADVVPRCDSYHIRSFARTGLVGAAATAAVMGAARASSAATLADTREGLARSASRVPGFGSTDVFYPQEWSGDWKVAKQITDVSGTDAYTGPQCLRDVRAGDTYGFATSFVQYRDNVVRDRTVVSDLSAMSGVRSLALWEFGNPNILKLRYVDGLEVDTQVTKRSVETSPETGKFQGFSEFFRLVEVLPPQPGLPSIPKIFAARVLTRFKAVGENELAALERICVYPSDTLDVSRDSTKALLTIKSKLSFLRS